MAAQRECILPILAGRNGGRQALGDTVGERRVMHLFPARADHARSREAGIIEPALVVPIDGARAVGQPAELGQVVGQRDQVEIIGQFGHGCG